MDEMESFFTREKANKGIKVPLFLPNGNESEHYLMLRGIDSDEFRTADNRAQRLAMVIVEMPSALEKEQALEDSRIELLSSLIISWSFEEECTEDAKKKLLIEAPQIADAIDRVAAKRTLFFGKESSS